MQVDNDSDTPTQNPPKIHHVGKTERVDNALERILEEESADEIINRLSDDEKELFWELVAKIKNGDFEAVETVQAEMWKVDFVRQPPTIKQFCDDEYWLGAILQTTNDNPGLFPIWRECLYKDWDVDSRVHNAVITGSLGIGKSHKPTDLLLMADGTRKMAKDVGVGDKLMGDDSTPRNVLATNSGIEELFEIKRSGFKNRPLAMTVTGHHTLCIQNTYSGEVVEIEVYDWIKATKKFQADHKLYKVTVKFPHKKVKIDPRWLGMWLGDGSWHECSITSENDEILGYHQDYATQRGLKIVPRKEGKVRCLCAVSDEWQSNPLLNDLRHYGLATTHKSQDKFIPLDYLANTREVRLKLLAGIIDTDGHYCNIPGCYGMSFKSKQLAEDVCQLSNSLGHDAWCYPTIKTIKSIGFSGTYWRINISNAHDIPCLLTYKLSAPRRSKKTGLRHGFTVTRKKESERWYGFELDGNHRYLMADCTVTHNSYVMCAIFLYRLALTRLLRNPQNFFGLGRGSSIFFAILSLTKDVVRDTIFGDIQNFMTHSAFFKEECRFNPDKKYADGNIELGNRLILKAGSKGWHIIGRNVMGVCLDEGNWRIESNPDEKAYKLYDEVRTRIQNRFQKFAGYLPAISILASSARDESSFTEKIVKQIKEAKNPALELVYSFPVYVAKAHTLKLKDRWFKVVHGLKNVDPYVLKGWYDKDGNRLIDSETEFEEAPPGGSTELVPEDYIDAFLRDTKSALQNIAGKAVGGSNRLFSSMVNIYRCMDLSNEIKNPCTAKQIEITVDDPQNVWDYLNHPTFLTKVASVFQPKRHPDAPRYAHMDLAKTGIAGLAICHKAGMQLVNDVKMGEPFQELRLIVEFDFILTIIPSKKSAISLEKIQNFFFWLRDVCGFRFAKVTADQFQSAAPLEMLASRGFNTKLLSVDRTDVPYLTLRSGVNDRRVRLFKQEQFLKEAEQLIHMSVGTTGKGKVDHPAEGSKDTTDAVAGAYYNAVTDDENVTPTEGSQAPGMHPDSVIEMGVQTPPLFDEQQIINQAITKDEGFTFDA